MIHLLEMEERSSPQIYFKFNRLKRKHTAQVAAEGSVLLNLKLNFISLTATKLQLVFLTTFYFRAVFNMSVRKIKNV